MSCTQVLGLLTATCPQHPAALLGDKQSALAATRLRGREKSFKLDATRRVGSDGGLSGRRL